MGGPQREVRVRVRVRVRIRVRVTVRVRVRVMPCATEVKPLASFPARRVGIEQQAGAGRDSQQLDATV